jgi:hypothetical protein
MPKPPSLPADPILLEELKKTYQAKGNRCPRCGADAPDDIIQGGPDLMEGGHVEERMDCLICDQVWTVAYAFASVTVHQGDQVLVVKSEGVGCKVVE